MRSAAAEDGSACFYNPAGLAFGRGYDIAISGAFVHSRLRAQDDRQSIDDPVSTTMTIAADVPLEGPLAERLRVGVALHALPDRMMRLTTHRESTPLFPFFDNRSQRLVVIPALAVRLTPWLGFGAGVDALAGVQGPLDVREGQSSTLETRMTAEAGTVTRWIAGVRIDPTDELHLAAVFRQSFGVPLTVTTTADVGGVPLRVDVANTQALFDPTTVVAGARIDATDRLSVGLEGTYQRWSAWGGPLLRIDTTVSALALVSEPPLDAFRDSFGARAAAAWQTHEPGRGGVTIHAGAGYESSMLDAGYQQGRSNFIDGPKMILAAGASAQWRDVIAQELRVSIGIQAQHVFAFEQDKVVCTAVPCPSSTVVGPDTANPSAGIDNPGYPTLSGSGTVYALSIGSGAAW